MLEIHGTRHRSQGTGWLRAAVLGANDGILSTAGVIVGVAAAGADRAAILTAGLAGLVAGALSMAAGEYVSVSSQRDAEHADLKLEKRELAADPVGERAELAGIWRGRGLDADLALRVADQLMAKDALAAHARDELGISEGTAARPVQAAIASAASFATGAALPLTVAMLVPHAIDRAVVPAALAFLAILGAVAARTGGASMAKGALRTLFWGAFAMALTAIVGSMFGAAG
ncbi:MAG TPA: VIT family protein [Rhodanobacteraceae bacterium]|jgi:VIT1/CCC1 family predicted Fe2+/Mn2+ transporter|nr:VIT family protein [Rhodanobacteraceae bacterium]